MSTENDDRNEQEATSLIAHSLNRERHGKRAYKLVESVIMGYGMMGDMEDSEDDDDYVPFDGKKQNNGGRKAPVSDGEDDDGNGDDDEGDDDDDDDDDDNDDSADSSSGSESSTEEGDEEDEDSDDDEDFTPKPKPEVTSKSPKAPPTDNHKAMKTKQELAQEINVCSVCLQNVSRQAEDVCECDSCGIMVHEWCYGVSAGDDQNSVHSNASSAIEEPWFCEPCTVGCKMPTCELCPNLGGIFKFTHQGRWIHMVCALYTKSVTFRDFEKLEFPSTSEIPAYEVGKRTCSLCEDDRLANTGVCLKCDTGMCNTYFHITCAQRHGLLKRTDDLGDSIYFHADCNVHNKDKIDIRKKRQSYLVLAAKNKLMHRRIGDGSIEESILNDRNKKKLSRQSEKFRRLFLAVDAQGSSSRTARALESSPSVVRRLCTKSEANGMIKYMNQTLEDMVDIRKKWYIPPAFSVEFVGYYLDRNERIDKFSAQSAELDKQNRDLKQQEAAIRHNYDYLKETVDGVKGTNDELRKRICGILDNCSNDKLSSAILSMQCMKTTKAQQRHNGQNIKDLTIKKCGTCKKTNDQYSLAFCDTCKLYYHLACLDPPLKRMPKKNRFGGWQCSNCTEKEEEDYEASVMSNVSVGEVDEVNSNDKTDQDSSYNDEDPKRRLRRNPKKTIPKKDEVSPFSVKMNQVNEGIGKKKKKKDRKKKLPTSGLEISNKVTIENGGAEEEKPPKVIKRKPSTDKKPKAIKTTPSTTPTPSTPVATVTITKKRKSTDSAKSDSAISILLPEEPKVKKMKTEDHVTSRQNSVDSEKKLPVAMEIKFDGPEVDTITPTKKTPPAAMVDCDRCHKSAPVKHSVRCDTCEHHYHFECLVPPLSKSPKRRGYSWNCDDCEKNTVEVPNGVSNQENNSVVEEESLKSELNHEKAV